MWLLLIINIVNMGQLLSLSLSLFIHLLFWYTWSPLASKRWNARICISNRFIRRARPKLRRPASSMHAKETHAKKKVHSTQTKRDNLVYMPIMRWEQQKNQFFLAFHFVFYASNMSNWSAPKRSKRFVCLLRSISVCRCVGVSVCECLCKCVLCVVSRILC